MNLLSICYTLEQTAQEKNLTILYVTLFVIAMGMLVLDTLAMKKWTPKAVKGFLWVIFVVALVALIILFVSAKRN